MSLLSEKLMIAILSLLLVVSPLQGAVAATLNGAPSGASVSHQMMNMQGELTASVHKMNHHCQQPTQEGCPSHGDASSHCANCVVGIPPSGHLNTPVTDYSDLFQTSYGFQSRHSNSLYRPPRG